MVSGQSSCRKRLVAPAATATATVTAVTAAAAATITTTASAAATAAVAATGTAAATTATAGLAAVTAATTTTTTAAATVTSAAATSATGVGALLTGAGLIDGQGAAVHVFAIEGFDCGICFADIRHRDEGKTLRPAGEFVHNDAGLINGAISSELGCQRGLGCFVSEVSNVYFHFVCFSGRRF